RRRRRGEDGHRHPRGRRRPGRGPPAAGRGQRRRPPGPGRAVIVIGLMSGTSMDGIDAAVADLELDGDVLRLTPLGHETTSYAGGLADGLRAALPPNETTMETVCRLDTAVGQEFAAAAGRAADRHRGAALVVAHGQTMFHWVEPDGR